MSTNRILLGIDPGLGCTGYSVIAKEGSRVMLIDYGILKLKSAGPNSQKNRNFS